MKLIDVQGYEKLLALEHRQLELWPRSIHQKRRTVALRILQDPKQPRGLKMAAAIDLRAMRYHGTP